MKLTLSNWVRSNRYLEPNSLGFGLLGAARSRELSLTPRFSGVHHALEFARALIALLVSTLIIGSGFAAEDGQTNSSNASISSETSNASTTSRAPFSAFKIITTTNI